MKLLFAHDHIIYTYKGEQYSNGSFSSEVLQRYVDVFGRMKFLSRQLVIQNDYNNLTLASSDNVSFVEVPNIRSLKKIKNFKKMNSVIKKEVKECDYLIARLPSTIGELAVVHARKMKKPYLIEVVGCAWDSNYNHGSLFGKIIAPFEFIINRKLIKSAPYVIYITKSFLQSRYPTNGKAMICPNVNIQKVDDKVLVERKKNILIQDKIIKFGLIGSLDVNYKGHDTVIKALGILKKDIPNFKVEFLGKGNKSRWIKLIKDNDLEENIVFIGTRSSGQEVYNWLDTIDIVLQPSYAEAQGRSIIEAMSRGCPVIATNIGGIVELIDNKYLISPGDYLALADKIKEIVFDRNQQLVQAMRNFEEAKQYYKSNIESKRKLILECFKNSNEV